MSERASVNVYASHSTSKAFAVGLWIIVRPLLFWGLAIVLLVGAWFGLVWLWHFHPLAVCIVGALLAVAGAFSVVVAVGDDALHQRELERIEREIQRPEQPYDRVDFDRLPL